VTPREQLDACQRAGLTVDEDFELGVSRIGHTARTALLAASVALIAATAIFILSAHGASVHVHQRGPGSRSRPGVSGPLAPSSAISPRATV
jgi:hypothetical protein